MSHIRALAADIGPRPTGQPPEERARAYIRRALAEVEITSLEEQPFLTRPTIGMAFAIPLNLALAGNLLSLAGRVGTLIGGVATLFSAAAVWRLYGGQRSPLELLEPRFPSANLIARLAPADTPRHTVVLIGHTDTQKKQTIAEPQYKQAMLRVTTSWLAILLINGCAQLAQLTGAKWLPRIVQWFSAAMLGMTLRQAWGEERHSFVAGANDNATAVACLLGLGAYLKRRPLRQTEVWLAFTGAEEVMCVEMHHFLDRYGADLRNAWFIDFEMVGTDTIAYVTRHSGLSYLHAYTPDAESLALAEQTGQRRPDLQVGQREMVIVEEVGCLRGRGFRGICLVGVGPDGWLANWHLYSDTVDNIVPAGVERAARFALAMLETLDVS
ncbi:MAG: M28 family peptidase [Roseiflexaceae bacterium]